MQHAVFGSKNLPYVLMISVSAVSEKPDLPEQLYLVSPLSFPFSNPVLDDVLEAEEIVRW